MSRASLQTRETPTTFQLVRDLKQHYNTDIGQPQLIGLCAYLQIILSWGFVFLPANFDAFVVFYGEFDKSGPNNMSYHEWIDKKLHQDHLLCPEINLVTESILFIIEKENPYTWNLAQSTLELLTFQSVQLLRCSSINKATNTEAAQADTQSHEENDLQRQLQRPHHSEAQLRESIGVRDKTELLQWLSQPWVASLYHHLYMAQLGPRYKQQAHVSIPGVRPREETSESGVNRR